jgi:pimeloyl-ACP methyl ester carboxylesterase
MTSIARAALAVLMLALSAASAAGAQAASIGAASLSAVDTLVNVGGYRLHFHIVPGHGPPIVFEAGGGDAGTVWTDLLQPLASITGAPLITYDRAGSGTSELDRTNADAARHGIEAGVAGLETGLQRLGYNRSLMLVAHSYGGFYATFYAARYPARVRAAVLIDANLECFYPDDYARRRMDGMRDQIERARTTDLGTYYQFVNFARTIAIVRSAGVPDSLPLTDIVSAATPLRDSTDAARWHECHRAFVVGHAARTGFTASGTGHYVFRDNPTLVVLAVAQRYAGMLDATSRPAVLERALAYAVEAANAPRSQGAAIRP